MPKITRDPLAEVITTRLADNEAAELRAHAQHAGVSTSKFIRGALVAYMQVRAAKHNLEMRTVESTATSTVHALFPKE